MNAVPADTDLLTTRDMEGLLRASLSALGESARLPKPFMVGRQKAAELCDMSLATYDKYARLGLLPRMNATRRVSVEALRLACLKLDGIDNRATPIDDAERALQEFEQGLT